MPVYVMRHGQSVANKTLVLSGVTDHPLTDLGREQARQAGVQLRKLRFDKVFCSRLTRAIETTSLVLNEIETPPIELIRDSELNERNFGIYEDIAEATVADTFGPAILDRIHHDTEFQIEGGESFGQISKRVSRYFDEVIRPAAKSANVLVVTHGNVAKCMIAHSAEWPLAIIPQLPMWNCLVTRLDVQDIP